MKEQPGLRLDSNPISCPTFSLVNSSPQDTTLPFVKVEVGQTLCCWSVSSLAVAHISYHVYRPGHMRHQRDLRIRKHGSQYCWGSWGWKTRLTIQFAHPYKLWGGARDHLPVPSALPHLCFSQVTFFQSVTWLCNLVIKG